MKLTTICFLLLCSFSTIAQNNWSKDQRNNLYEDYLAALGRYEGLTKDQKESIGLCGLETTTAKYPRDEYANKIEIEIKRITESTIAQCAKNIGVDLKLRGQNNTPEPAVIVEEIESTEWSKEDKTNLVKESTAFLSDYDHLTNEQIDEISLCYMNKTIAESTNKDHNNMISIELKKHIKTTVEQCSKSNDIDLSAPEEIEVTDKSVVNKEYLIGTWSTDQNMILTFNSDGTFTKQYKDDIWTKRIYKLENGKVSGEWFLDENGVLTLNEKWIELNHRLTKTDRYQYTETGKYKFISNSEDFFKIQFTSGVYCCQESQGEELVFMQANRVK